MECVTLSALALAGSLSTAAPASSGTFRRRDSTDAAIQAVWARGEDAGFYTCRITLCSVAAWRPTQQLKLNADGSCILEFTTQNFDEVKLVFTIWSGAEVLEPPELSWTSQISANWDSNQAVSK